jgi:hypothetical protein
MFKLKLEDEGIPKIRVLDKVVLKSSPHFGNVPHMWTLPILKHEVSINMNLNMCKSPGVGGEGLNTTH